MKIAIFNYNARGLFHHACGLVEALATHPDINDIYFFTSAHNELRLIQPHPKIKIITSRAPHHLGSFLAWCLQLSDHYRIIHELYRLKPDIIHIVDSYPVYFLYHFALKKYPIVFTQHDPVSHAGEKYRVVLRLIHWYLQRISRRIVVHGNILKTELIQWQKIAPHKISTIPLSGNTILLRTPRASSSPRPGGVLFFGRIVTYKGLDILLKSLIILQNHHVPFHFILAGEGDLTPYQADLNRITSRRITNHYIPAEKVSQYLAQAEVIVLPYREATQSGIACVALAAGTPIIASNVGALPEILIDGYNSLLIPPQDPHALAAALKKLLSNSSLQAHLQQGAKETVTTTLAWPKIVEQYYQVYQSAV